MTIKMDLRTSKPSEIIFAALNDLEAVEARDDFVIKMSSWYIIPTSNMQNDKCSVCFAGGVMARMTDYQKDTNYIPGDFDGTSRAIFHGLDLIRHESRYTVNTGLEKLFVVCGIEHERVPDTVIPNGLVSYHADSGRFKAQRRLLASRLAARGF